MTLTPISNRCIFATLTSKELSRYSISLNSMSVDNSATRIMLGDLLSILSHMGMRSFGDSVTIDCLAHPNGNCGMIFTVCPPVRWIFNTLDDLLFAAQSGVLPKCDYTIKAYDSRWLLTPQRPLSRQETVTLSEFGTPVSDA